MSMCAMTACVEVRGQFEKVCSLPLCGSEDQTQSVSLGNRLRYPLNHLRQIFRFWSDTGVNIGGGLLEWNEVFYI